MNAADGKKIRDESAAFIASWRERGGYIGALSRLWRDPTHEELAAARTKYRPRACPLHMPFPHKHCGEWR